MYIDENESGLQLVVKGIDGVNEMLAWFFHKRTSVLSHAAPNFCEIWIAKTFGDTGQKSRNASNRIQVRLDVRTPALALLAEVDMVVEDLRLLLESKLAHVDHRASVGELCEIALP